MKFYNPMNYVLVPLLLVGAGVLTYMNFGTDMLDGTPLYWILMGFYVILAVVAVIGEKMFAPKKDKVSGKKQKSVPKSEKPAGKGMFKWQSLLGALLTVAGIGGVAALCMWKAWVGITFFVLLGSGLYIAASRKDKKDLEEQKKTAAAFGEEQAPRYDSFYFGYYHPDKEKYDPEKLARGIEIVSRGKIPAASVQSQRETEVRDGQGSLGYFYKRDLDQMGMGAAVDVSTDTENLVRKLNRIITAKELPVGKLAPSQITARDNGFVKNRRQAGFSTMDNDINVACDLLAEQGYVLIQVLGEGLNLCLSIVTPQEAEELKALEI